MDKNKDNKLLIIGILVLIGTPFISILLFKINFLGITSFVLLGMMRFLSIILIILGIRNLFITKRYNKNNKQIIQSPKIDKNFYKGIVSIVIGLALFAFGFHYMSIAECSNSFFCGFDRVMYNFTIFIPLSIIIIIYGFYLVRKSVKNF